MQIESQLYTFIDHEQKLALYFLEGQKVIHDLVLAHDLRQGGFSYFRASILSVQLMQALLKPGESFCFYIDSESPYFRLKIEMNTIGLMRGMLYPNGLNTSLNEITGKVRLVKFLPHAEIPYQSTIELKNVNLNEIINQVLEKSYQVNSRVSLSENSDQSYLLHQLPLNSYEEPPDLKELFNGHKESMQQVMAKGLTDKADIQKEMSELGFKYLANKPVQFKCGCSKEEMTGNVKKFADHQNEDVFRVGEEYLEVICEYCKTAYQVTKADLQNYSSTLN